jgi:hypothetical protein
MKLYRGAGTAAKWLVPTSLLYSFRDVVKDALK